MAHAVVVRRVHGEFPRHTAHHTARWVVEPGRPALARIAEHFGTQVLQADGQLNRGALRNLIFIDPPTFSNSKRMEGIFDVQRDHVQLLDLAMARLAPCGVQCGGGTHRGRAVLQQREP